MPINLMRSREREARTTPVELFFDLVYVLAVTQLSGRLVDHTTAVSAGQDALLLAMVWLAWMYTSWTSNWLDPDRLPVRVALLVLMAASLVLSAGLPQAFGVRGAWVGGDYAFMQVGRSVFTAAVIGDRSLRHNYQRITCWCVASGAAAILGGLTHGHARVGWWLAAVAVDVLGGAVGFWTPGLGRSRTRDWTIEGSHIADRCQAFLLIALGEGVVRIGATLTQAKDLDGATLAMFVTAFVGSVLLWWVYFDRSADDAAEIISTSDDPGRLGRTAYHMLHPIMVAGVVVTAAADDRVVRSPGAIVDPAGAWIAVGGVALFLLGHSLFKMAVWRRVPLTRLAALVILAVLGPLAVHLQGWQMGAALDAVLAALIVTDRALPPHLVSVGRPLPASSGAARS